MNFDVVKQLVHYAELEKQNKKFASITTNGLLL